MGVSKPGQSSKTIGRIGTGVVSIDRQLKSSGSHKNFPDLYLGTLPSYGGSKMGVQNQGDSQKMGPAREYRA